jgi:conjugative transfer region protein TrbK
MRRSLTLRQIAWIAAVGFVAVIAAWAINRGQRSEDAGILAPLRREEAGALASELTRCRTVTSDQIAELETCRRVWAENRRQFFRPTRTPPAPAGPVPTATTASGKSQDRASPVEAGHQQSEVR